MGAGSIREVPWLVQDADGRWVSTKQWYIRARLSDGSIEHIPLVLSEVLEEVWEEEAYGYGSRRRKYRGSKLYFVADVSHIEGLQHDIQDTRDALLRHGLVDQHDIWKGLLTKPVTKVTVRLMQKWVVPAEGLGWWAHLSANHTSTWLVLFRPIDDSAFDIDATMEGLGVIDGRILAIMPQLPTWTWGESGAPYEWATEAQEWVNVDDDRQWWIPSDEYNHSELPWWNNEPFSYDFEAWATDGEEYPASPNSQTPISAERYADYEDAYEKVTRDGKKATSSAIGRIGKRHPKEPIEGEPDGD